MSYFLTAGLAGAVFAYLLIRTRYFFFNLAENTLSLLNAVLSEEEDIQKQSGLIKALKKLLTSLVAMLIVMALVVAATAIPLLLYSWVMATPWNALNFSSWTFVLSFSLGSLVPFVLPSGSRREDENYSEISQLFHRLILNNYNLSKLLFSADARFKKNKSVVEDDNYVMVSGLARAGTTSVTSQLFDLGQFSSLDYSNMPVLIAPNIWKRIYSPKKVSLKERKHGDRMLFGLNTVEALEEYFFKVFLNDCFITERYLKAHAIPADVYTKYKHYQTMIRTDNKSVYLSKNNNLILRYASLREFDRSFKAIFLFRQPLEHAQSLLYQHQRFCKLQQEDSFIIEYMNWLGHHEFGTNQKVFNFSESDLKLPADKEQLDYWLAVWTNYYAHLLRLDNTNLFIIDYKDYLHQPVEVFKYLSDKLDIPLDVDRMEIFENKKDISYHGDASTLQRAQEVYEVLLSRKATF